jgi:dolichyl-phosphate beta-glucosyltransferase
MQECLQKQAHLQMIMGIRIKRLGSKVDRKLIRHYLGRVFATFVSLMLGLPTYDTQCGAKIISANLAKEICNNPFSSAWFFDVELIMRIKKLKGEEYTINNIYEYPLFEWNEIEGSKIKPKHYLLAPFELLKIKFRV